MIVGEAPCPIDGTHYEPHGYDRLSAGRSAVLDKEFWAALGTSSGLRTSVGFIVNRHVWRLGIMFLFFHIDMW